MLLGSSSLQLLDSSFSFIPGLPLYFTFPTCSPYNFAPRDKTQSTIHLLSVNTFFPKQALNLLLILISSQPRWTWKRGLDCIQMAYSVLEHLAGMWSKASILLHLLWQHCKCRWPSSVKDTQLLVFSNKLKPPNSYQTVLVVGKSIQCLKSLNKRAFWINAFSFTRSKL